MNAAQLIRQPFGKLSGLWVAFLATLVVVAIGLGMLSRHALQLQYREQVQQSVRVALWRLDSRLAPYVATIHQQQVSGSFEGKEPLFIRDRFFVSPDPGSQDLVYRDWPNDGENLPVGGGSDLDRRPPNLPIQTLLLAVGDLVRQAPSFDQVSSNDHPSPSAPQQGEKVQYKSQSYPLQSNKQQQYRKKGLQKRAAIVQQQVQSNAQTTPSAAVPTREPQMLSIWMEDQLAIVRTRLDGQPGLEGVWIDWDALHQSLVADIDDLLPAATIRPAGKNEQIDPETALAALPAQLVPGDLGDWNQSWSSTHTALILSWAAFAISALVAGIALSRLIALSERRAAFVSAVTHELRTPLTTFRLYSDLLARDMITDPEDQRSYLATLRREADRLTHLVDNVLRYSRLERTSKPAEPETIVVSQWIERVQPRLHDRLDQAGMSLEVRQDGDGRWRTDPPAMEQVLFNLIDNAAKYAMTADDKRVLLDVSVAADQVQLTVTDHGDGVPESLRRTMFQPFSKSAQRAAETAAGVGLGLALVKRTVTTLAGEVEYSPAPGGGASFRVRLPRR